MMPSAPTLKATRAPAGEPFWAARATLVGDAYWVTREKSGATAMGADPSAGVMLMDPPVCETRVPVDPKVSIPVPPAGAGGSGAGPTVATMATCVGVWTL